MAFDPELKVKSFQANEQSVAVKVPAGVDLDEGVVANSGNDERCPRGGHGSVDHDALSSAAVVLPVEPRRSPTINCPPWSTVIDWLKSWSETATPSSTCRVAPDLTSNVPVKTNRRLGDGDVAIALVSSIVPLARFPERMLMFWNTTLLAISGMSVMGRVMV